MRNGLGGGALFFAMAQENFPGRRYLLSDINQNLVDAYEGVRDHVEDVIELLKSHDGRHDEKYFYKVRKHVPDDIAGKAARIIYLNRTCFNGLYRENSKGEFNVPFGKHKNPLICDEANLKAVSGMLRLATISAKPFDQIREDVQPGDLVYFDPPYAPISQTSDFTTYAKDGFGSEEHLKLAELATNLADSGVKVVLSNSLTTFTRNLYERFYIREVSAQRIIGSFAERRGEITEILATSFPLTRKSDSSGTSDNIRPLGS